MHSIIPVSAGMDFLLQIWYDAMLLILVENNADSTLMFIVPAKQCCTDPRPFSVKREMG